MAVYQNWGNFSRDESTVLQENDIAFYQGNQIVMTTQRGVTLAFIKLLYNSEINNGYLVLLGVRSRDDPAQKVISSDNAVLDKAAYDLIETGQDPQAYPTPISDQTCPRQLSNMQQILSQLPTANFILPHQKIPPPTQNTLLTMQSQDQQILQVLSSNSQEQQMHPQLNIRISTGSSSIANQTLPEEQLVPLSGSNIVGPIQESVSKPQHSKDAQKQKIVEQIDLNLKSNTKTVQHQIDVSDASHVAIRSPEPCARPFTAEDEVIETGNYQFHCEICHLPFKSRSKFEYHKRRHTEMKPFVCSYCGESFQYYVQLSKHRAKLHLCNKTFKCKQCPMSFSTRQELKRHMWRHTGIKMLKCNICYKEYTSAGNLASHQKIHQGNSWIKCSLCPKIFKYKTVLESHIRRVHTGERPFTCRVCPKSFPTNSQLSSHEKRHSDYKPYSCNECGKSFRQNYILKRHQVVHSEEKPFKCHLCAKSFRNFFNMQYHKKTHLKKEDRCLECPLCGKMVIEGRGLKRHLRLYHDEKIASENEAKILMKSLKLVSKNKIKPKENSKKCEDSVLAKPAKKNIDLENRKSTKAAESGGVIGCQECSRSFKSVKMLESHRKRVHRDKRIIDEGKTKERKSYSCSDCGKSFRQIYSLKRHLRTHTKERPYQCEVCLKTFRETFNLTYHMKTHQSKSERSIACPICEKKVVVGRGAQRHLQLYHGMKCANEDEAEEIMRAEREKGFSPNTKYTDRLKGNHGSNMTSNENVEESSKSFTPQSKHKLRSSGYRGCPEDIAKNNTNSANFPITEQKKDGTLNSNLELKEQETKSSKIAGRKENFVEKDEVRNNRSDSDLHEVVCDINGLKDTPSKLKPFVGGKMRADTKTKMKNGKKTLLASTPKSKDKVTERIATIDSSDSRRSVAIGSQDNLRKKIGNNGNCSCKYGATCSGDCCSLRAPSDSVRLSPCEVVQQIGSDNTTKSSDVRDSRVKVVHNGSFVKPSLQTGTSIGTRKTANKRKSRVSLRILKKTGGQDSSTPEISHEFRADTNSLKGTEKGGPESTFPVATSESSFKILSSKISKEEDNGSKDCTGVELMQDNCKVATNIKELSSVSTQTCIEPSIKGSDLLLNSLTVGNFGDWTAPVLTQSQDVILPLRKIDKDFFNDKPVSVIAPLNIKAEAPRGFSFAFLPVLIKDELNVQLGEEAEQ